MPRERLIWGMGSSLFCLWAISAHGETDACAVVLQKPDVSNIAIHSAPSIESTVIAQLSAGQLIGVGTLENRNWAHLEYVYEIQNWRVVTVGKIDGWVEVRFLLQVGC
jgi:hypothetical protein